MKDIVEQLYDGDVCSPAQNYCRNKHRMEAGAMEIERLQAENKRLLDGIEAIAVYGNDTVLEPMDSEINTRGWQREAVVEMTSRAKRLLSGGYWDGGET